MKLLPERYLGLQPEKCFEEFIIFLGKYQNGSFSHCSWINGFGSKFAWLKINKNNSTFLWWSQMYVCESLNSGHVPSVSTYDSTFGSQTSARVVVAILLKGWGSRGETGSRLLELPLVVSLDWWGRKWEACLFEMRWATRNAGRSQRETTTLQKTVALLSLGFKHLGRLGSWWISESSAVKSYVESTLPRCCSQTMGSRHLPLVCIATYLWWNPWPR